MMASIYFIGAICLYILFVIYCGPLDSCSKTLVLLCSISWPFILVHIIYKYLKE